MSETDKLFDQILESKPETKKEKKPQIKAEFTDSEAVDLLAEIKKLKAELNTLKKSNTNEPGNPANEWAKKLAQEKANRKPKAVKSFFTIKEGKVLKVDIKKNGCYSAYIGNYKKNKDQINPLILQWKKQGLWIDEFEFEIKTKEIMNSLEE